MVGRILFTYRKKKSTKKDKEIQNKTKENYVQRTIIYNNTPIILLTFSTNFPETFPQVIL